MKITLSRTLILFSCLFCLACLLAPANSMALVFTPMDDLLEYQPKISQEQAMEIAYEHAVESGVPFDEYTDLGQHRINGRIHIGGHAFCENQQDALCICSQGRTDSSCQAGPVSQNQIR